jgi:hypothetical protein
VTYYEVRLSFGCVVEEIGWSDPTDPLPPDDVIRWDETSLEVPRTEVTD